MNQGFTAFGLVCVCVYKNLRDEVYFLFLVLSFTFYFWYLGHQACWPVLFAKPPTQSLPSHLLWALFFSFWFVSWPELMFVPENKLLKHITSFPSDCIFRMPPVLSSKCWKCQIFPVFYKIMPFNYAVSWKLQFVSQMILLQVNISLYSGQFLYRICSVVN